MEVYHIVIDFISLLINVGLMYFAVRLLSIFRGGMMAKPWVYISYGVLTLAISTSLFTLQRTLNFEPVFIHVIAGSIMMIGGLLMLIGMYFEYKNWVKPA